ALVELTIALALSYLYIRGGGRFISPGAPGPPQAQLRLLSRPRQLGWLLYLTLTALVFLGPLASVVASSFLRPWQGTAPTLAWYGFLISGEQNPLLGTSPLGSMLLSLRVGAAATLLALALGLAVSWTLARARWVVLETVLMAPLAVSSVVLGLALLIAFRRPPLSGLGGGELAIVLAHGLIIYPLVVRMIRPLWQGLDPALVEAARTLGANRFRAFLTVELPLLSRGLLVAASFAFALSLGEMTAVAMLARPGLSTMPLSIYHLISARKFGAASALATVLILLTGATVALWELAGRKWLSRYGQA
ncbi:ABC transporter permease subunit, partial [Candidatus Bipolaricaulota bacterium]|nr:ABC transporter permease subunit [Candidatus Bipolaricaulota bacterium]